MSDATPDRPVRAPGLEVTELAEGLVVYQSAPERVHHLNATAAYVFELSTGERTVAEIAEEMRAAFGLSATPSDAVAACLGELREKGLVG